MRLNLILIEGNLTRDAELKYTSAGKAVSNVTVAWNSSNKPEAKTVFVEATIWEKTAEVLQPYLKKGGLVRIIGHLSQDRWEKDGEKKSKLFITATQVDLLGGKKNAEDNGSDPA